MPRPCGSRRLLLLKRVLKARVLRALRAQAPALHQRLRARVEQVIRGGSPRSQAKFCRGSEVENPLIQNQLQRPRPRPHKTLAALRRTASRPSPSLLPSLHLIPLGFRWFEAVSEVLRRVRSVLGMTLARPSLRLKLNVFKSTSPIQSAGSVSLLIGKPGKPSPASPSTRPRLIPVDINISIPATFHIGGSRVARAVATRRQRSSATSPRYSQPCRARLTTTPTATSTSATSA